MHFAIVPEDAKRRVVVEHGPYQVWYDPLAHTPWGLYRVYRGERYCGAQISWPCRSDCEWLDKWRGVYAMPSPPRERGWTAITRKRREALAA
jgi:hypothetical protein